MSLGLKTKENAGKTKYSSLNLNQTYRGSKVEVATKTGTARHGLQSLGKVGISRRVPPPANLPSLKSENSGNDPTVSLVPSGGGGWGSAKEKSEPVPTPVVQASAPVVVSSSTPPPANVLLAPQNQLQPPKVSAPSATAQPPQAVVQNTQGQTTTITSKSDAATKSWGSVSSGDGGPGKPYSPQPSLYFNREFPVLGGGNSGDRPPDENQQPGYVRGTPPLRPPYDQSWADKPGSGPPPADHGYSRDRDRDRGTFNGSTPTDFTPYYNRNFDQQRGPPPGKDFGQPPYLGPNRSQPPPAHPQLPPAAAEGGAQPQRGSGPPHKGQQRPGGKNEKDAKGEGYTRPSIIRASDIQALDDDEDEEGGWAGAQEEVDYSAKLVFEDFGEDDGSGRPNGAEQAAKYRGNGGDNRRPPANADRQRRPMSNEDRQRGQYDQRRYHDNERQRRPPMDDGRDDDRQRRPQEMDRQRRGPEDGDAQRRGQYNDWMPKHFSQQDPQNKGGKVDRRTAWQQDQSQSRPPPSDQQSGPKPDYQEVRGGRHPQAGYDRGPPGAVGFEPEWQQGPPHQKQGPPHQKQGPPHQQQGPPHQQQGPPHQQQGPPHQKQGPPHQQQGPPHQQQGPPHQQQGPPHQQQGPPHQGQGPPHQGQGPLHQGQGPPHQGPPQQQGPQPSQGQQQQGQQWQEDKKFRSSDEMRIANDRARRRREEEEKRRQDEQKHAANARLKALDERKKKSEQEPVQKGPDDVKSRELDKEKDIPISEHDDVFIPSKDVSKERQGEIAADARKRNDSESSESSRSSFHRQEHPRGTFSKNLPPRFQRQQQTKGFPAQADKPESTEQQQQSYGGPASPVSPSRSEESSFPVRRIMKRSDSGSAPDDNVSVKSVDSAGEKEVTKPSRRGPDSGKEFNRKFDDRQQYENRDSGWQERGDDRRQGSQDREDRHTAPQDREDRRQAPQDREDRRQAPQDREDRRQAPKDREDRRQAPQDRRQSQQDKKEDGKERWQGNKDRRQDNQNRWHDRQDGEKPQGRRQESERGQDRRQDNQDRRQDSQYRRQDKWQDRRSDDRDQDKKQDKRQTRTQDKSSERSSQHQTERFSERQDERKQERLPVERKIDSQDIKSTKEDKTAAPVENIWEKRKAYQETKLSQERKVQDEPREKEGLTEEEKERKRLRDMDVRRHLDDIDRSPPPRKRESDSHDGREVKRRQKDDDTRGKYDGDYDDDRFPSARGRGKFRVSYPVRGRGRGASGYGGRGKSDYSRASREYYDKRRQGGYRDNERDERPRHRDDERETWKNRGEKDTRPNRAREPREDRDQERPPPREKDIKKDREPKEKKYVEEDTRKPTRNSSERIVEREVKEDVRRGERRERPTVEKDTRESKNRRDDERDRAEVVREEEPRGRDDSSKPLHKRDDSRDYDSRQPSRQDSNRERYEERPMRDNSSRGRGRGRDSTRDSSSSRGRGTTRPARGNYREKSTRGDKRIGSGRFNSGASSSTAASTYYRKQEEESQEYTDSDDEYYSDSDSSYTSSFTDDSEEYEREAPPAKPKPEAEDRPKESTDKGPIRLRSEDKDNLQSHKSADPKPRPSSGSRPPPRNAERPRRQPECPPRFLRLQENKARGRGRGITRTDAGASRGRGRGRGAVGDRKSSYSNDRRDDSSIPATEDWDDDIEEQRDKRGPPDRPRRDNSSRRGFSGTRSTSERNNERSSERNNRSNRNDTGDRRRGQPGRSQHSAKRDSFLAKKQQVEANGSYGSGNQDTASPAALATMSSSDLVLGKEHTKSDTKKATSKDTKGKADKIKHEGNKFNFVENFSAGGSTPSDFTENKKNQKKTDPAKSDISHIDVNNIAKVIVIDDIVRPENEDDNDAGEDGFVEVTSRRTQKELREKMREEEDRKRTEEKKKPDETPKIKPIQQSNVKKQQNAIKIPRFGSPASNTPSRSPGIIGKLPTNAVICSPIMPVLPGVRSGSSSNSSTKRNSPVVMEKTFIAPPPPSVNAWDKPLSIIAVKATSAVEGQDPLAVGSGKPSSLLQLELEKIPLPSADIRNDTSSIKDDSKSDSKAEKENRHPKTDEKNRTNTKKDTVKGDKKAYQTRTQKPPRFEKAGLGSKRKSEYEKETRPRTEEKPAKLARQGSKSEPPKDDSNKNRSSQTRTRNTKNNRVNSSPQKARPATEVTGSKIQEETKDKSVIDTSTKETTEEAKITKDALEAEKPETRDNDSNLEEQNLSSESDGNLSTGDLKNVNDDTDSLLNAGPLTVDIPETAVIVEEGTKRSSSPVSPALAEMSKRMDAARAAWNATSVTSPITSSTWEDTRNNSPIISQSTSVIGNTMKDNATVDLSNAPGSESSQVISKVLTNDLVKTTDPQVTFAKKPTTGEQQNVCKVKPQQQLPKPQVVDIEQPAVSQSLTVVQDQIPPTLNNIAFPTHTQYPFLLENRFTQPQLLQLQPRQQPQTHSFLQQQQQQPSFHNQHQQLATNFQQQLTQVRQPVSAPSPMSQPDTRLFQQTFLQGPMYSNSLSQPLLSVPMLGSSATPTFPTTTKTPGTSVQSLASHTKPAPVSAFAHAITPSPTQTFYMPFDPQNFGGTSLLNLNPQQPNQRSGMPQQQVAQGYYQNTLAQQSLSQQQSVPQNIHHQNSFGAMHGPFMQASQGQKQRVGPFQVPSPDQLRSTNSQPEDTSSQSDLVKHINAKPFEPPKRLSTPNSGPSTPSESPGINPASGIGAILSMSQPVPIRPRPITPGVMPSRTMSVSPVDPNLQLMGLSLQQKPNMQFMQQQQPPRSQHFPQFHTSMQMPPQQQQQFVHRPRGGMMPNQQMLANLKGFPVRTPPPVGTNNQHITTPRFPAPIQRPSSVNMQGGGHVQPIQPPRMRHGPPMQMMAKQGFVMPQQQMNMQRPPPPPVPPPQQQQQQAPPPAQAHSGQDAFKAMQRQKMIQETQKYFTQKDGSQTPVQQPQSQVMVQPQVKLQGQPPMQPNAKQQVLQNTKPHMLQNTKPQVLQNAKAQVPASAKTQVLQNTKPQVQQNTKLQVLPTTKQPVLLNTKSLGTVVVQPQGKYQGPTPVQSQQQPKAKGPNKNSKPRQQSYKGKQNKTNNSGKEGSNKSSDETLQAKPKVVEEAQKTSDNKQETTKKVEATNLSTTLPKSSEIKSDSSTGKEKKVFPVEPFPQRQSNRNRSNRRVPRNGSMPSGKGNGSITTPEPAGKISAPSGKETQSKTTASSSESKSSKPVVTGIELATLQT